MITFKKKLTEGAVPPTVIEYFEDFPNEEMIPSHDDVVKFMWRLNSYLKCMAITKEKPSHTCTPWGYRYSTKDLRKVFKTFLLAVHTHWTSMAEALRDKLYEVGYSKENLREVINYYTSHAKFSSICEWVDEDRDPTIEAAGKKFLESVEPSELEEDIEKHEELNPKLFDGNTLKPDIKEKMLEIVQEFVSGLEQDQIGIKVDDILFLGSNASYNYTKDSDIDLHIIVDPAELNCSEEVSAALYGAYRSLFNNKLDIDFYGIPVELYVETPDTKRVSNGIYSVMNNAWVKEPEAQDIPEIDMDAFKAEYDVWEVKCKDIKENAKKESSVTSQDVDALINEIYEQRKAGLAEGEYSIGNLIFKELRNVGLLDELKDLKNELRGKELSLKESFKRSRIRIKNNKRAD